MTSSLDPVLTDPNFDPAVSLLLATDLSIHELLGLKMGDVYSGALLALPNRGGRRVVRLRPEARLVISRLKPRRYDPDAPLLTDAWGGALTHEGVLRLVSEHLDLLFGLPTAPSVRSAIRRLGRVFKQGFLAA